MSYGRNSEKYTSQAESELLVLKALATDDGGTRYLSLSNLGYVAYPGYQFKSPQGAALAVARLVRSLVDRKLVRFSIKPRGYCVAAAGLEALQQCPSARGA
jgi:hypothetical protein